MSFKDCTMSKSIVCKIVIFIIAVLENIANAQHEDSSCTHNVKGVPGICKKLHLCQDALKDLQLGIYPQICGLKEDVQIICCSSEILKTMTIPTVTATTKSDILQLPVGEKSKQACENYAMLAYKKVKSGSSDEVDLIPNCPWEYKNVGVDFSRAHVDEAEFPHLALIGYDTNSEYHTSYPKSDNYTWLCSGNLISDKFVLTAAHCLNARNIGTPKVVRLSDLDYIDSNDDGHVQNINIKNTIPHPLYKYPVTYNDIALLELEHPAELNLYVKPACLYRWDSETNIRSGMIAGWAIDRTREVNTRLVKGANIFFITEMCNQIYGTNRILYRGIDPDIQICFGPKGKNHTDTCQGDSGIPIQIYNKDVYCSYYIFALTSFGKPCGISEVPAVYVKLYKYIEWIENIVWP